MHPFKERLHQTFKQIVQVVLIGALTILSLEGVVRLAAFVWRDHGEYYLSYGFHSLTGKVGVSPWWTHTGRYYKFPPHYLLKGAAGQASEIASINSLGFRGPEFQPEKPAGAFRIICMGESSTGYRNTDTGTYPFFLEKFSEGSPATQASKLSTPASPITIREAFYRC